MGSQPDWDISGKTVLITGGNAGIGKAITAGLAAQGAKLILASRDVAKSQEYGAELEKQHPNCSVKALELDLTSLESVRKCAADFLAENQQLHVLVLNAGMVSKQLGTATKDGFELTFGVNQLAHFLLTKLLLDRLKASAPSRIVVTSSNAYVFCGPNGLRVDDLPTPGKIPFAFLYPQSKLANFLFVRSLHTKYHADGISAFVIHPGTVRTKMTTDDAPKATRWVFTGILLPLIGVTPEVAAQSSVYCASERDVEHLAGNYVKNKRLGRLVFAAGKDDVKAEKLWELCERLTHTE